MEYPGNHLTKRLRHVILAIFVASFFIIAPLVVLYTTGYRYDWKNVLIKTTGSLSINVLPKNAKVFLNGSQIKQNLPVRIKNLGAGQYKLAIKADGYYNWQREIEIVSKQTTYIKDIEMIKKEDPIQILTGHLTALSLSPNGRYLIYSVLQDNRQELWLRTIREQKNTLLFVDTKQGNVTIKWAEKNDYAAIAIGPQPHTNLILVNANSPVEQIDLAKLAGNKITKFSWKETKEPNFYFSTSKEIISFVPKTGRQFILSSTKNYLDWFMEQGQLWTTQINTSTSNIDIYKDSLGFSTRFNSLDSSFNPLKTKILVAKQDQILLNSNEEGQFILVDKDNSYKIIGNNFLISKYADWWLFWTPWELWGYQQGGKPTLISRSGKALKTVVPMDKHNTLGLVRENKTAVLYPYYYINHNLLNEPIGFMVADPNLRIIYYTKKSDDQTGLWSLKY